MKPFDSEHSNSVGGVQVMAEIPDAARIILTPSALSFLATLHRTFNPIRKSLLLNRVYKQKQIDEGQFPTFLSETEKIRHDPSWQGAPPAPGLVDRRVEITGPVSRKMVINALNSGAQTFMADFEDSSSPTWENMTLGQVNLYDAVRRTIQFKQADGKVYELNKDPSKIATLLVRPRGWHMDEQHLLIDGEPCSASLMDFGLYFFHNAKASLEIGHGPYFYLPKIESHLEARLWNDVFNFSQDALGIPRGTIRGTVLIETILAAFEMEEIIFELRLHSSGLNCGRWDYIFSFIKKFRNHPEFVLPARAEVTMTTPFMHAYVQLLIQTCHRRGVHAMGGMAAQIPIRDQPEKNKLAMEKVRADKLREVNAGHDGTWVAHPDLIPLAKQVFDEHMKGPHQLHVHREHVNFSPAQLIQVPRGSLTESAIRINISVALIYIAAWLRGQGCVPIHNLMEDAATAEISRSQLWQWKKHMVRTEDGTIVTETYLSKLMNEEVQVMKKNNESFQKSLIPDALDCLKAMVFATSFPEFLTTHCYYRILTLSPKSNL